MNNKKVYGVFRLSLLAAAVGTALPAAAAPTTPFAPIPLHLTSSSSSKAKPNVQLLLDNSGSMMYIPEDSIYLSKDAAAEACAFAMSSNKQLITSLRDSDAACLYKWTHIANATWQEAKYSGNVTATFPHCDLAVAKYQQYATCRLPAADRKNRIDALKAAMQGVLTDPANQDLRWGVSYLNYTASANAQDVKLGDNTAASVLQSIQTVRADGGTPSTQRYAKVMHDAFVIGDAIQYRCQKNFAIVLSDGAANGVDLAVPEYKWYESNWSGSGWNNNDKITYANWILTPNSTTFGINGQYGMYAMSNILANKDLKPASVGTDKEGGNWDSPDNADWEKQTVSTSVIAFSLDIPYLQNGAQGDGSRYFTVSSASALTEALNSLVRNASTAGVGYSTTTPSISGSSTNLGTISLTLNLAQGFSTIQFVGLQRSNGKLVGTVDSSRSIKYGALTDNSAAADRRVLLSYKQAAPKFLSFTDIPAGWPSATNDLLPTVYSDWIIRHSSKSDSTLTGTRTRGDNATDPKRMMGDVVGSSVLQIGSTDGGTGNTGRFTPYLLTAANDGMVHIFTRNDADTAQPYSLKMNWIPGSAPRESSQKDNTVWAAVKNTVAQQYLRNSDAGAHTYLLNGGLTYRTTYGGQTFAVGALGQGGKGAYALNVGGKEHAGTGSVGVDSAQTLWPTRVPLWETANNLYAANKTDAAGYAESLKMGYTVGTPVIDRVATARSADKQPVFTDATNPIRYAAVIGGGYFGSEALPALYVYDPIGAAMTYSVDSKNKPTATATTTQNAANVGKLLARIAVPDDADSKNTISVTTDDGQKTMNNGLSAPALMDLDDDGVTDVAYAGDLRGNMYRFDLRGTSPAQWTAQRILKGSPDNPITAAPALYRQNNNQVIVTFGTGRDLFTSDLTDKTDQFFYAVYDDLTTTRQANCGTTTNCVPEVSLSNRDSVMLKQTVTQFTGSNGTAYRALPTLDRATMDMKNKQGWYIPLTVSTDPNTGERVVTQPSIVDNAVFFTTRIYKQDTSQSDKVCSKSNSSGYSWLMGANVVNGSNLSARTTNLGLVDKKFYSGQRTNGITSNPVFIPVTSGTSGSNTDTRNDSGQVTEGADRDLTQPQTPTVKTAGCGVGTDTGSGKTPGDLAMNDSSEGFVSQGLYSRTCNYSIARISWRELF